MRREPVSRRVGDPAAYAVLRKGLRTVRDRRQAESGQPVMPSMV